ncbi:hypothetical protein D9Q98_004169 [Chlorella vulgaris]|uniref:Uncharacterized protein n=1 Tax=Chlorella vulgaris TaxID=3077 RepID=A0A9D4YYD6_CHLVU|nr:hypothetical protein D9Q98_004169 [Chlorella vulgaris]
MVAACPLLQSPDVLVTATCCSSALELDFALDSEDGGHSGFNTFRHLLNDTNITAPPPATPPPSPPSCPEPSVVFIAVLPGFTKDEPGSSFGSEQQAAYLTLVSQQGDAAGGIMVSTSITEIEDRPEGSMIVGINVYTTVRFPGPTCQEPAAAALEANLAASSEWMTPAYGSDATTLNINSG